MRSIGSSWQDRIEARDRRLIARRECALAHSKYAAAAAGTGQHH
jgi:hypothetical protein